MVKFRENPQEELKAPIIRAMDSAGLQDDCPFAHSHATETAIQLDENTVVDVADDEFLDYMGQVNQYLQVSCCIKICSFFIFMSFGTAFNFCLLSWDNASNAISHG